MRRPRASAPAASAPARVQASALLCAAAAAAAVTVTRNWVFEPSNAFGDTYTHMSTLALTPGGGVAAACQAAAKHEGDDDQHVLFARSTDGGASFGAPEILARGATAVWGPVLFFDQTAGTLWIFFSTSAVSRCVGGSIVARTSSDSGASWSAPRTLLARDAFDKITANPLVVTPSGRWLLPYWDSLECEGNHTSAAFEGGTYKNVTAHALISDDHGVTWRPSGGCHEDSGLGLIEGTLLARDDGSVLQYFRTGEPVLYASTSPDGGETWPNATATNVPNPNAKVCLLSEASLPLLAFNDDTSGRSPLSLASSDEHAEKWAKLADLEETKGMSFAYPTVVRNSTSGEVLVSYSYNYKGVKVAHVTGVPPPPPTLRKAAALSPSPPLAAPVLFASKESAARFVVDNAGKNATWQPKHPDTLLTYLTAPKPLAKAGDVVKLTWQWRSNGTDECASSKWGGKGCFANGCDGTASYKSVHCVGGTGDFRIFVGQSAGVAVSASGFCETQDYNAMEKCLSEPPFSNWKGYNFRIFPHVGKDARNYPSAVPCGFYKKQTIPGFLFDDSRITENGCFQLPAGAWGQLTLSLERKSASDVKLSMAMNGEEFSSLDSDAQMQPSLVDAVAIQFPNGRPYETIQWSTL